MSSEPVAAPVALTDLQTALDAARRQSEALQERTAEVLATAGTLIDAARRRELGQQRVQALIYEVAGLRKAMESRAVIEQAKGVLIATTGCDADEAFKLLVSESQHENRKLREVAEELVVRNQHSSKRPR
jgi:Icc-related predicted phosphoesterase